MQEAQGCSQALIEMRTALGTVAGRGKMEDDRSRVGCASVYLGGGEKEPLHTKILMIM